MGYIPLGAVDLWDEGRTIFFQAGSLSGVIKLEIEI
jgi:hypothetical protein